MTTKDGKPTRLTVDIDHEFVVVLIGMRVNTWWKVHKWLPVAIAMRRMIGELQRQPEAGLLGGMHHLLGNPIVYVQYWRSYDALEAYSRNAAMQHRSAWSNFYRRCASGGDVGIWHEAYRIAPGHYECVYVDMPPFGLGKTAPLVPAQSSRNTSRGRMERWRKGQPQTQAATETAEAEIG